MAEDKMHHVHIKHHTKRTISDILAPVCLTAHIEIFHRLSLWQILLNLFQGLFYLPSFKSILNQEQEH